MKVSSSDVKPGAQAVSSFFYSDVPRQGRGGGGVRGIWQETETLRRNVRCEEKNKEQPRKAVDKRIQDDSKNP